MAGNLSQATLRSVDGTSSVGDIPNPMINCCYDFREPSYNTVVFGDTIKGFLPAGSYGFTREGTVVSYCTGKPLTPDALYARTNGPVYGPTMGACVPRGSQSVTMNYAGAFNVLPSTLARGCYV